MDMPIFATSWMTNCNWCHFERNSPEGVLSEAGFIRFLRAAGWKIEARGTLIDCTCPSCVRQGRG
jgi:hypothetical protein